MQVRRTGRRLFRLWRAGPLPGLWQETDIGQVVVPGSVEETLELLAAGDYIADRALATVAFLALSLNRPLLLEGEAGVGKTELAKVLSKTLGRRLIRLQCFEGLDLANAAYEWDYPRQMVAIRMAEAKGSLAELDTSLYSAEFLIERPLLAALRSQAGGPPVLLIDEIDRADAPFEAFLLEVLSDFQISIPEFGTVEASSPPIVIITSNRTREIHDALRRRCLYHWLDYPSPAIEEKILAARAPDVVADLRHQVAAFVQEVRRGEYFKPPGVAESLDWVRALSRLDVERLDAASIEATVGSLLKYPDDLQKLRDSLVRDDNGRDE